MKTLGIIGGGNLGKSILAGLLQSSNQKFDNYYISRRRKELLANLKSENVNITSDNTLVASKSDILILAVKPHQAVDILKEIKHNLSEKMILISVVTGVSISEIGNYTNAKVYRAMPNTAIAIQQSLTCIAGTYGEKEDDIVKNIFDSVGVTVKIEDELMGAATVVGACGIAYALRYLRAATQGGVEIGFSSKTSQLIAAQTVKGACELLLQNESHPEEEIDKVTTPMGITISGLNEMEHQGFSSALIKGIVTSYEKIDKI